MPPTSYRSIVADALPGVEPIDGPLTTTQRCSRLNAGGVVLFTVQGLKALLKADDAAGAALWETALSPNQWEQLAFAINLQSSMDLAGQISLYASDVLEIEQKGLDPEFVAWWRDTFLLLNGRCGLAVQGPIRLTAGVHAAEVRGRLTITGIVGWLFAANRVVTHLGLRSRTDERPFVLRGVFPKCHRAALQDVYEGLRPAADLWRTLPWGALGPFEALRAARVELESVPQNLLYQLACQISDRAWMLDDNTGRDDERAARWWSWAEHGYDVHVVPYSFSPVEDLREVLARIKRACAAFDPANPDNAIAIDILERWKPVQTIGSIIADQTRCYDLLRNMHAHLEYVLALVEARGEATWTAFPPMQRSSELTVPLRAR